MFEWRPPLKMKHEEEALEGPRSLSGTASARRQRVSPSA